jgi:hypothetical protein
MMRPVRAGLAVAAGVVAIALSGCGSSSTTSTTRSTTSGPGGAGRVTAALSVTPATATPTTAVHFSFVAPAASGRFGSTDSVYTLSVVGPHRGGCVSTTSRTLPAIARGQQVSATLDPGQLGGHWCPGTYTARVDELARPICPVGQACPQFVRLMATVGPATFRVTG